MSNTDQLRTAWHRVQNWVERRRIKRRRRKLVEAYAQVGEARYDLGPGFSPTMFAYDQLLNGGLIVIVEDGETRRMVWNWPEGAEPTVLAESTPRDRADVFERGEADG